jgi:3-dehydroquinate dehydratase-1
MKIVKVKGINIGEGSPKIIVPIVGKTKNEIIEKAKSFEFLKIDIVEWRVDFFNNVYNITDTLAVLKELRAELKDTPILFTFRTKNEGGEKEISIEAYTELNKAIAESGNVDLIDVEIFLGDDIVKVNIDNIHRAGSLVVGSNHDFFNTPEKDDIVSRLCKMQDMGVDIPKIAVMPNSTADVITLLSATNEMHSKYADRPIVTMSMGAKGVISRLSGEVFGSSMTFGSVGQVSAPGQIPVEELGTTLNILHKSM